MSNRIGNICEKAFLEHPEFRGLVEDWAQAFDEWDLAGVSLDDEELLEEQKQLVSIRAARILRTNHPKTKRGEPIKGLIITPPELWAVRAMLLATEMRNAAEAVTPQEVIHG